MQKQRAHIGHHGPELLEDGTTRFRLWAPDAQNVSLIVVGAQTLPMTAIEEGWYSIDAPYGTGTLYRFLIDDELHVPDPASRAQAGDVHAPSLVVDTHNNYLWRNGKWLGRPWHETVLYETHVGLYGGFAAMEEHLAGLAELGVTAIELMPIAEFPGDRNWGYDGVLPYAPEAAYGSPEELKHLIDTAHGLGLMVFLDVVYNHFGPDGNYLGRYAKHFFRHDQQTPWGDGIDFRRRIAENTLGALTSLDTFQNFIFGTPTGPLPQNLYWIDFDDPRRGTPTASPFDFNSFRDNALPLEGGTAPGDSGGPLILDRTFARQVVIGVLSGGFSRFFNGQPSQGYGSNSFYQPLYLYWDYIAANNPYRYVSAVAGDGNWTDPTHWVTNVDPNYQIIGPNGQLVTGIPTNPGGTTVDTSGAFGQVCFQNTTVSDCLDVRTGVETITAGPIGTGDAALVNGRADALLSDPQSQPGAAVLDGGDAVIGAQADGPVRALPPATIANGLPGATNFVPNNVDPVRTTGALGRYFDVTLSANGTTTLNSAVTIDRLTIAGAGARLNIDAGGSLTSLISVTQTIGTLQVNGVLSTPGDYFLMVGGLNGTGTIFTPFFTNMLGVISPGASGNAGSIGTLNFRGNVILSSGSTYLVDLGANGNSDRISVLSNGGVNDGIANVGGGLAFNFGPGGVRAGNVYTIVQAQNGVTGTFAAPTAISAILTPTLTYSANQVQVSIAVGSYRAIAGTSTVQQSFAQLLDQNRGNAAALDAVYGPLDLQNAATIRATLDALAPRTEALVNGLATAVVDNNARFHRDRLAQYDPSESRGGTIAVIGQPIQLAAASASSLQGGLPVQSDTSEARVTKANLPDDIAVYLAGGYIDGSSAPGRQLNPPGARDTFNGFYIIGGIEKDLGDGIIGLSFGYTDVNGRVPGFAQTASGSLYQGTLYARSELGGGWSLDGQVNAGLFDSTTIRNIGFVGTNYRLVANKAAFALGGEIGVQRTFPVGFLNVAPRISVRSNFVEFGRVAESGGGPALVYNRADLSSVQGRAGINLTGTKGSAFRPYLSGSYVREFDSQRPNVVGANFVGGSGPDGRFLLAGIDRDWFEISGGISYTVGNVELSLAADTTIGRDDVQNQSYRGAIKLRF